MKWWCVNDWLHYKYDDEELLQMHVVNAGKLTSTGNPDRSASLLPWRFLRTWAFTTVSNPGSSGMPFSSSISASLIISMVSGSKDSWVSRVLVFSVLRPNLFCVRTARLSCRLDICTFKFSTCAVSSFIDSVCCRSSMMRASFERLFSSSFVKVCFCHRKEIYFLYHKDQVWNRFLLWQQAGLCRCANQYNRVRCIYAQSWWHHSALAITPNTAASCSLRIPSASDILNLPVSMIIVGNGSGEETSRTFPCFGGSSRAKPDDFQAFLPKQLSGQLIASRSTDLFWCCLLRNKLSRLDLMPHGQQKSVSMLPAWAVGFPLVLTCLNLL